jgi:galactonate dehydratase
VRIADIEWHQAGRWFFVLVHTENGITGLGEGGVHAYPESVGGILQAWKPYLLGSDPLRIEHHWQYLYRNSHFRGAVIGSAISALDIALWDIAGKYLDSPVYQLLGGRCRNQIRLYTHVDGEDVDTLASGARLAVEDGFTAVRIEPFPAGYASLRYAALIAAVTDRVAAVRDAVGNGVDLCVEVHRRMDPAHAAGVAREIAKYRPLFVEDPIVPDSVQNMAALQKDVEVPIATGERLHTIWEFNELLASRGCRYVRPDVCLAGGLTHTKKIAALAEAYHVGVIPHNPLSPVSTAACVQLDASVPNFVLQEYTGEDAEAANRLVKYVPQRTGGYLEVSDRPGIGVELDLDAVAKYPAVTREVVTPLHEDGSVADW